MFIYNYIQVRNNRETMDHKKYIKLVETLRRGNVLKMSGHLMMSPFKCSRTFASFCTSVEVLGDR